MTAEREATIALAVQIAELTKIAQRLEQGRSHPEQSEQHEH